MRSYRFAVLRLAGARLAVVALVVRGLRIVSTDLTSRNVMLYCLISDFTFATASSLPFARSLLNYTPIIHRRN